MKKTMLFFAGVLALCGSVMAITVDEAEAYIKANASMWLDASSHADFTFNSDGKITAWRNKADKRSVYGDAVAYTVPSHSAAFATRGLASGRMAVNMGGVNSGIDFKWNLNGTDKRMTKVRTLFLATTIAQSMQAFWLGDTASYPFHRGEAGQYIASYSSISSVRQDGTAMANLTTAKPPTDFHIYALTTSGAGASDRMTLDRNCSNYNRNGGRVLSEEIVFEGDAPLDAATIQAIEQYLDRKWRQHYWAEAAAAGMTGGKASDGSEVGATAGNSATLDAVPAFAGGYQQFGFGQIHYNCGTGVIYTGPFTQVGGIIDAAGATIKPTAAPTLYGPIAYSNVVIDCTGFGARYRPKPNTYIVVGDGATIKSNGGLFADEGNVTYEIREGGLIDNIGDVGITVDYATSNRLYIAGGTLKSTQLVKIMTQTRGGTGVLTMTDGELQAPRLSIAGSWNSTEAVVGTARVDIGGGTITLTDNVVIGANSGTHGTAYVHFGGGTIIAPNGLRCYYNDTDHISFDGTVFKATKDNSNYLILHKATSSDLTIGPGGFILDDAGYNVGISLATLKGTGAFVKRGAGKVTLAVADNPGVDVRVEAGTLALTDANAAWYAKSIELADGAALQLNLTYSPVQQKTFAGKVKLPATGTATIKVACTDQIPKGTYSISTEFEGNLADNLQLVFDGPAAGTVEGNLSLSQDGELQLNVTKSNNPGGELVWAPATSTAAWSVNTAAWKQKNGDATLINYFNGLDLWFGDSAAYHTVTLAENVTPGAIHFTGGDYTLSGGGKLNGYRDLIVEGGATVVNTGVLLDNQPITITNGTFRVNANTAGLLGANTAAITVKNGGALDVKYDSDWANLSATVKAKTAYIEGAGPDGNGAFLNSGSHNAWRGDAPKLVLTGDATIGGKGGYRMQSGVTGANYTLTVAPLMEGSNSEGLNGICIDNSAMTVKKLVVESGANFCFTHNSTAINATEGVELKAGSRFEVWDSTANVTPNFVVKAGEGDLASATTLMGCGWTTGKYTGTVTAEDGAHLQIGANGRSSMYDNDETFSNPVTLQGSATLKIAGATQYFYKGIVSAQPVTFEDAGNAVLGNYSNDLSANGFPAGGFTNAGGAHNLYLRPSSTGMNVSGPVALRNGAANAYVFPQLTVPYGVIDFTANCDASGISLGDGASYSSVRLSNGAFMHLDAFNGSNSAALKEGYLAVDDGTLEIGQYGLGNTVGPYSPDARLRLNAGKLRSSAAWTMAYGFFLGFYGPSAEPFEWEVNYNNTLTGAIGGTGAVKLTGAADVTGANARAAGICDGKWTIESTGANNLTAASAFSGGLELAEGVTATINLGTDTPGEGYVGMLMSYNASERETALGARKDLVFPQIVDRMVYLHGRNYSDWLANNTCVGYEGEFYVSAENANKKWTFAGAFDDYIAMYVDGVQVFASEHCAAACGTTAAALAEGWHTFRVMAYDISGNDGPTSGSSWNNARMSVGWLAGESTSTDAAAYTKFDTDTLRMRPIERTGLLWQQVANPDNNATWRNNDLAWTSASITNEIKFLHTKTVFTQLAAKVSRFSGWFYVSAERAGKWHFWGNWDDNMLIAVDGVDCGITGTNATPDAPHDFTLAEGWHRVEIRVRDISGGYGPWDGAVAMKVKINDGDWLLFDERNFDFMPMHPELKNVCAKVGSLGGELVLGAGATLVNESTKPARITGTLSGTGALSGAFAFTGADSCWSVTGAGNTRVVGGKAALEVSNADALAGLGKVKAVFAQKPTCAVYDLSPALGLTAQAAEAMVVEVRDSEDNDYSEDFTAAVRDNRLVLVNAHPGGLAIVIR